MADPKLSNQFPYFLSPNFQRYLDIDRRAGRFIIRSTLTEEEQVVAEIPEHLMKADKNFAVEGAKFRWINNRMVKIINDEGIERVLDLDSNFAEMSFNSIPMFDASLLQRINYFFDLPVLQHTDTLGIYQRKYQQYKSTYFINRARDNFSNKQIDLSTYGTGRQGSDRYAIKLSFSFLHWKIIEQLLSGRI